MKNLNYNNWGVGLCHATGELIQDGFYLQCDDLYFSTEAHLLNYLRAEHNNSDLSDDELLKSWYATDDMYDAGYYYSVWEPDESNINYIETNGEVRAV